MKKDEELAEEYYYKTYPVTLNIGEEERKKEVTDIFLAGLKAGRPQWHDLRKDPNDLPNMNTEVLFYCYGRVKQGLFIGFFKSHYGDCKVDEVIAWCEIPTFDKE